MHDDADANLHSGYFTVLHVGMSSASQKLPPINIASITIYKHKFICRQCLTNCEVTYLVPLLIKSKSTKAVSR